MNHFQLIVIKRIDDHKAAETKRIEAEREKIRAEEVAKLEREKLEQERKTTAPPAATNAIPGPRMVNREPGLQTAVEGRTPASQLSAPLKEADRMDARGMLTTFLNRFGEIEEFAAVVNEINAYFRANPEPAERKEELPA